MTEEELNSRVPIIPHAAFVDTNCPGCLVIGINGDKAEIICNECGVVIRSLPVSEVVQYMNNLAKPSKQ